MAGSSYMLSCQEGQIKVFLIKANGEKELLATLDGGESQSFDMTNPQPEPEPQPEPATDAGQPQPEPAQDTGPTQPEPSAPDANNTAEPTNPQPETTEPTTPQTPKPPSDNGGCSTINATGENPNSTGHLATLALALMALGAIIRKREKKTQPALQPSSILTRTRNWIAHTLGFRR